MRRIVDLAELGRLWASGEDPFRDDALEDRYDDEDDDAWGPIPCDGSGCCPCGSCDARRVFGAPTRRPGAVSSTDVPPPE
ncbi:hypothetical protein [Actinomycetospora sp. CA-084318]|uniref:hypothetical protein n=1 Tax=Actinomycetospora sp. CA-084318 TaxID=3239892 RepID=UPI003D99EF78